MANNSRFQTEIPTETLQQQFAKKFSHLLSAPPQSVGPQNIYWQYSHGFDSPLPTGGHCSAAAVNSDDTPVVKTLTFPDSPESSSSPLSPPSPPVSKPKSKKVGSNKKTTKAKKAGKKSDKKSNSKTGGKKTIKKKPITKKAQALNKLLKLFS